MFETSEKPTRARTGVLAIIMFGILVLCVALAWWLSESRRDYTRTGEQLMQEVRQAGLASFFAEPVERYYLLQQEGRTIGWGILFRQSKADGGFQGLNLQVLAAAPNWNGSLWESWSLNANATQGQYLAGKLAMTTRLQLLADTVIQLNGEKIRVQQKGLKIASQGTPPANYLPEGCLPLAAQLVARDRTHAYFKLIYNTEILPAIEPGKPPVTRYGLANIEYRDTERLEGGQEVSVMEMREGVLGREEAQTLYLDKQGVAVKIVNRGGLEQVAVSLEQVLGVFPEAARVIQEIASDREIDYPWPTNKLPAVPTAPSVPPQNNSVKPVRVGAPQMG